MPRDRCRSHNWDGGVVLQVSAGKRPGMLLSILQCIGQPHNKALFSPNSNNTAVEKLCPGLSDSQSPLKPDHKESGYDGQKVKPLPSSLNVPEDTSERKGK